ncbi:MAG: Uma2 family endonuclease [Chloroflexia bacterium]|nr:Uma2 family endonuclease [Chloroflexia bacterium]
MSVALHTYTYPDLAGMPDDGNRYEIIGGELIVSPGPSTNHRRVVNRLSTRLSLHVWAGDLGEVFTAPVDVVLSPYNAIQPDILFVSRDHSIVRTADSSMDRPTWWSRFSPGAAGCTTRCERRRCTPRPACANTGSSTRSAVR